MCKRILVSFQTVKLTQNINWFEKTSKMWMYLVWDGGRGFRCPLFPESRLGCRWCSGLDSPGPQQTCHFTAYFSARCAFKMLVWRQRVTLRFGYKQLSLCPGFCYISQLSLGITNVIPHLHLTSCILQYTGKCKESITWFRFRKTLTLIDENSALP